MANQDDLCGIWKTRGLISLFEVVLFLRLYTFSNVTFRGRNFVSS